jgi:hypothetical protein
VLTTLNNEAWLLSSAPEEFAQRMAEAVLTAGDKTRYVVVTSDYLAYGPYATRNAATNAVLKGFAAYRPHTEAMVLPLAPSPTKADLQGKPPRIVSGQMELPLEFES